MLEQKSTSSRHSVCQFLPKLDKLTFLVQFFPKMDSGRKFRKLMLEWESASSRCHWCQFSGKTHNFNLFNPDLPKNEFWGEKFKNRSLDSESASLKDYVYQFSDKTDNFEFWGTKFAQKRILGSKIWESNSELSVLSRKLYTWYLKDAGSSSNICFINSQLLIPLWANLEQKSLSCSFFLKVGGYWLLFQHFLF